MRPQFLTRFIGRERELTEVHHLLQTARLVTITGAGGCGKTRLAVQAARQLNDVFEHGVHFVPLAAIDDPSLVIPTVAQTIGVGESPDELVFDRLKAHLRRRQALLLLDNFEQIIPAAPLLTELLLAAEQLTLLVTSREALRLRGEHEFPLQPLDLFRPDSDDGPPTTAALSRVASVQLFVERAQASAPEFQLTDENGAAIVEICARLDGLPLAIELAAVRSKLLPPRALLGRLQESALGLLTSGARDLPARQQTLRATVQWSYDLLSPVEQRTFRWLAAFVGGCALDAIIEMMADQPPALTLDTVSSLVSKSLVRQADHEGEPRLSLLETVREFGLMQLEQTGELATVREAQALYFLRLAQEAESHLSGATQKAWLRRLEREYENFRAMLRWGFSQDAVKTNGGESFVLRLTAALSHFWYLRGHWGEGRRWLEEAVQLSGDPPHRTALRAEVLLAAATLIQHHGDLAHARLLCEQSIELYRQLDDTEGVLAGVVQLCRIMDYQADHDPLPALISDGLALAESLPKGPARAHAFAQLPVAAIAHDALTYTSAARYLAEGERIYRSAGHLVGLANTLSAASAIAGALGNKARSMALLDEAEALAGDVEDQHLRLGILGRRTAIHAQQGDFGAARRGFEQILAIPLGTAQRAGSLESLAVILQQQGLTLWAARVFGLADKLAAASRSPMVGRKLQAEARRRQAAVRAEVAAQLGETAFTEALMAGRNLTLDDLVSIPDPDRPKVPAPSSPHFEPLTPRETEVLRLLGEELSNPAIAARLVISRRTVDAHLRAIYGKLGVNSREAAVRLAAEHGLLEK